MKLFSDSHFAGQNQDVPVFSQRACQGHSWRPRNGWHLLQVRAFSLQGHRHPRQGPPLAVSHPTLRRSGRNLRHLSNHIRTSTLLCVQSDQIRFIALAMSKSFSNICERLERNKTYQLAHDTPGRHKMAGIIFKYELSAFKVIVTCVRGTLAGDVS